MYMFNQLQPRVIFLFISFAFFFGVEGQASFGNVEGVDEKGILTLGTELEGEEDEESMGEGDRDYSQDIIVVPNLFPERLTQICYPRTLMMRDRFCIGDLDAYALACASDRPPLQLAPFCYGFDFLCASVNFPDEDWCEKDLSLYTRHCAFSSRKRCKSCDHDVSCSCEPYDCVAKLYELYCNETGRREFAESLVLAMQGSVRLHPSCMRLFNLGRTICNPFKKNFDFKRCQKFLLDCEFISDFREEDIVEEFVKEVSQREQPQKQLQPQQLRRKQRQLQQMGKQSNQQHKRQPQHRQQLSQLLL